MPGESLSATGHVPWDRLAVHKDNHGRLSLQLAYADGLCAIPTEWMELNPSHQAPEKHNEQTPVHKRVTVYAFHPFTVQPVVGARRSAHTAFKLHFEDW